MRKLRYAGLTLVILIALIFPFTHVGGNYYRGILMIWYYSRESGGSGGFVNIQLFPDHDWYSPVWFADPTSFRIVDELYAADRFSVYLHGEHISNTDGGTFHSVGNGCYVDLRNARCEGELVLRRSSRDAQPESFDVDNFMGNLVQKYGEGNPNPWRNFGPPPPTALYVWDSTGIFFRDARKEGVDRIGSNDYSAPVYTRVDGIDPETFEVWSIHTCILDKYQQCSHFFYDKCMVRDKDFVYDAEIGSCKMTGTKQRR